MNLCSVGEGKWEKKMGRKHSPKGQIVLKKTEKLEAVRAALPSGSSPEEITVKFQEMYPED
jgi:hypothetical protein